MAAATNILHAQDRKLKITVGGSQFTATLNYNETVEVFVAMLPLTLDMSEMGGYEKFHNLPQRLPGTATNVGTTYEGDLMIWSGNYLVLFYTTRSTSYSYIRLGRIDNNAGLRRALGTGNVRITIELEGNPTGIEDIKPAEEPFHVSIGNGNIEITGNKPDQLTLYNITGAQVEKTNQNMLQTGNLPPGIYILRIDSKAHVNITRKIRKG